MKNSLKLNGYLLKDYDSKNIYIMFRSLINNNIKTIGIRRLSNCSSNCIVLEELKQMKSSLESIYFIGCFTTGSLWGFILTR